MTYKVGTIQIVPMLELDSMPMNAIEMNVLDHATYLALLTSFQLRFLPTVHYPLFRAKK